MKVLMISPGRIPVTRDIDEDLASLQSIVDGPIQVVYPFEEPVALICHEEGKLLGLPLNRCLRWEETGKSTISLPGPSFSAPHNRTATTLKVCPRSRSSDIPNARYLTVKRLVLVA